VVHVDLDRQYITNAGEFGDAASVILRQLARERAEAIGLEHDQRALGLLALGQFIQPTANRAYEGADEQGDSPAADGDQRPGALPPDVLQDVRCKSGHEVGIRSTRMSRLNGA